jgi:hypothetical protein
MIRGPMKRSILLGPLVGVALALFSVACGRNNSGTGDAGNDAGFDPGSRAFLETCNEDLDCEPNTASDAGVSCQVYTAKNAKLCTHSCTAATAAADCPAPSPGCNNMGVCRAP